jgi:adenosine deaminase
MHKDIYEIDEHQQRLPLEDDVRNAALKKGLQELPKVDLHRHLTGSIRLTTVAEIAQEYAIVFPRQKSPWTVEDLRQRLVLNGSVGSLSKFIAQPWRILNKLIVNPQVLSRLAYEAVEDASIDNVAYLELRASPFGLTNTEWAVEETHQGREYLEATIDGLERAADLGVVVRLILSIPRHVVGRFYGGRREHYYDELLALADEHRDYVVGFDLTGVEEECSSRVFESFFKRAKEHGFFVTIHAGETTGPESVREAIGLGADRIGHCISSIEDPSLVQELVENGVTLEICPTSNILTGAVASLQEHPFAELYGSGVRVTVNTDNTLVCDTTLTKEFYELFRNQGLELSDAKRVTSMSVDAAFLSDAEKDALRRRMGIADSGG